MSTRSARRTWSLPDGFRLATEAARAGTELTSLMAALPALRRTPKGDGHPVLVLPGLGAGDSSTVVLRGFLRDRGYQVHGWRLGVNVGPRRSVRTDLEDRVRTLAENQPISIVGWSLGGVYAHELGRTLPDRIRTIVTLGSPLWRLSAGSVPTTSIFSRDDAIVAFRSSLQPAGRKRENVEVRGSHLGFGHNPAALVVIADRLSQPSGAWKPFDTKAYGYWFGDES